jgi:hypothetical protein
MTTPGPDGHPPFGPFLFQGLHVLVRIPPDGFVQTGLSSTGNLDFPHDDKATSQDLDLRSHLRNAHSSTSGSLKTYDLGSLARREAHFAQLGG